MVLGRICLPAAMLYTETFSHPLEDKKKLGNLGQKKGRTAIRLSSSLALRLRSPIDGANANHICTFCIVLSHICLNLLLFFLLYAPGVALRITEPPRAKRFGLALFWVFALRGSFARERSLTHEVCVGSLRGNLLDTGQPGGNSRAVHPVAWKDGPRGLRQSGGLLPEAADNC